MTDRAQMGPTPIRPVASMVFVLIGILVANDTTILVGAVVAVACLGVVWWKPLAEVVGDD